MIADSRDKKLLVDASFGRSTKSVILMNSDHLILSALAPEELVGNLQRKEERGGNV